MNSADFFSLPLLDWYAKNGRDLPWRKNVSAYHVVVSEIMLQQTQVSRVIVKYHEFLELFPTIFDLAHASKSDVITAWSGLGYNRRALLLHQFAQVVVEEYAGEIPSDHDALLNLPGIGPYAAGSICSFAFNKPQPAIDVNVRRIYCRYFYGKDQGKPMSKKEERALWEVVRASIPDGRSRDLHNGLMDFGSMVCLRKKPICGECPLSNSCSFFPLYDTKGREVLQVMEKKQEKGREENGKHIPNRIFRGRIVEFVRQHNGENFLIGELGLAVKKDYIQDDEEWLLGLIEKLQKEGMIGFTQKGKKIKLVLG